MLLKSLDIQGFKSFPDRTHIAFNSGVTVIVGPNGSGKSNISDAIRWVLGEQSTKALRGGKMEDVIFSGAGDRRAMAAAEVSLTIDNSSGFLKSEYNEVTVTRKYYRSGDSEFFINRKAARLRDIHELFMDTGLGRDGYSMISQGKIDEILSVKSEERREMFDEATGISKYRYRREEAQRRLADADANLTRINDMIDDMSARLEPMRIEAEREQKYIDLQAQLKTLDISLTMQTLSGIGERLAQAKLTAQTFADDLEKSRAESERLGVLAEGLIRENADNQRRLEGLRDELREGERETARLGEEIAVRRAQADHISEDIARMQREAAESVQTNAEIESQLATRRTALADAEKMAGSEGELIVSLTKEADRVRALRMDMQNRLRSQQEAESAQKAVELETSGKLASSNLMIEELSAQLRALTDDAKSREEALAREQDEYDRLSGALEDAQERQQSLSNIQSGFSLKLENRRKKVAELEKLVSSETVETASLGNRLTMLRDLERDYEGFNRAVKVVMRESAAGGLRGIHGPISSLMTVDEEYIPAAETALGSSMQDIVVDTDIDSRNAMGLLKSRDAGRLTFLPLSTIRPNVLKERGLEREAGFIGILSDVIQCDPIYRPVFEYRLGRTVIVDHLDNAIRIARNFQHRFRIVTLDGQIVNAGGSMTGGSLNRSSGVLSRANEIEKLEKAYPKLKQRLDQHTMQLDELSREAQALEYQQTQAQNELRAAQDEVVRLSADLSAHATILENLNSGDEDREQKIKALTARIDAIRADTVVLTENLRAAREKMAALEEKHAALDTESNTIDEKSSQAEVAVIEARMRLSGLEAQVRAEHAALEALEQSRQQADARSARRDQEISEAAARREDCLVQIEELSAQRTAAEELCEEKSAAIRREVDTQHDYERRRIDIERSVQDENRRMLDLERRSIRAQAELEAVANEESALDSRLWDSYELTRTQARELAQPIENRAEAERELEKYKRSIRALGSIYPGAIREYQGLVQRHEFMSGQKHDAEVSRNEILDIIGDINSRMRDIFSEQFAIIARNFTEIFKRIFGGGTAKIELSDPNDVLTSGIDIMVQPPGKQLKVLTLLSGGERALAAIALYFAIMTVRPAPFCVLDEIESALDEANVRLFGRYLREMSDKVQFIVISHRRGTMESADMLYGVAMPKQGISRILALNVAEAEKEYIKE